MRTEKEAEIRLVRLEQKVNGQNCMMLLSKRPVMVVITKGAMTQSYPYNVEHLLPADIAFDEMQLLFRVGDGSNGE